MLGRLCRFGYSTFVASRYQSSRCSVGLYLGSLFFKCGKELFVRSSIDFLNLAASFNWGVKAKLVLEEARLVQGKTVADD